MKRLLLIALVLCSSLIAADRRTVMRSYQASAVVQTKSIEFVSATPSYATNNGSGITIGTIDYSIVGWIKPLATGNDYGSWLVQSSVGGIYYRSASLKIDYFVAGDNLNDGALTENAWWHISIVNSNGTVRFYTNGVLNGSFSLSTGFTFNLMGSDVGLNALKARCCLMAVHNIVLTPTQIANLANRTTTSSAIGSTLAYWKFDEGSGTSAADSSGNGKTLTLSGTTWATDFPP